MAFSMHSHSGQFCPGHAKDTLEEVILKAISMDMQLFALTEHMPRDQEKDRYPEEVCKSTRPHIQCLLTPITDQSWRISRAATTSA